MERQWVISGRTNDFLEKRERKTWKNKGLFGKINKGAPKKTDKCDSFVSRSFLGGVKDLSPEEKIKRLEFLGGLTYDN